MKLLCFCLTVLFLPLTAQELDLAFLKNLESKAAEHTVIDLGPEQLSMLSSFTGDKTGDIRAVAKGIERIQVRSFEFDTEGAYNLADMEKLRDKLKTADYFVLISSKERKGFTEILMRKPGKGPRGFIILAAEPRELTIINITGDLDLNAVGKAAAAFGLSTLSFPKDKDKKDDEEN